MNSPTGRDSPRNSNVTFTKRIVPPFLGKTICCGKLSDRRDSNAIMLWSPNRLALFLKTFVTIQETEKLAQHIAAVTTT